MKKTQVCFLYFLITMLFPGHLLSQNIDLKKGTITVRKPFQQEYYIEIDSIPFYSDTNLFDFISSSIQYSNELKKEISTSNNIVMVSCIIDTIGKIEYYEIIKSIGFHTDKEALRVINKLNAFTPFIYQKKKYAAKFNLPIKFEIK